MAFGNFFTRALDVITPWDRGGEVERRKKREEEQMQRYQPQQQSQAPSSQSIGLQDSTQQPERPKSNISIGLLDNRVNVPKSEYDYGIKRQELEDLTQKYRADALAEEKKRTSWFDRQFTDRGWDKRAESIARNRAAREFQDKHGYSDPKVVTDFTREGADNIGKPEMSQWVAPVLSIGRVGTGIAQGAAGAYDLLTPGKGQNRITQATTREAENIDKTADDFGVRNLYRTVNVPLEIASYFTPGVVSKGGRVAEILDKGVTKSDDALRLIGNPKVQRFLSEGVKELLDPRNIALDTRLNARYLGQDSARGEKMTPKLIAENALQSLAGAFLAPAVKGVSRFLRGSTGSSIADEAIDAAAEATGGTATAAKEIDNLTKGVDIPVRTQGGDVPIPVRTPNSVEGDIIRELAGDAPNVTRVPTQEEAANIRANNKFKADESIGKADQAIEGVTPRESEGPFKLEQTTVKTNQDQVVKEYADFLQSIGEGNGVDIVDGKRLSNNVRFGDTKGKRMTKADWIAEAERQLSSGKADPAIQKQFDELASPEIQSLLNRGDQIDGEFGQPIKVKEVRGIDVQDRTDVPQGLPEKPGTVRATTATEPTNARTQAVAEQSTPVTPRNQVMFNNNAPVEKRLTGLDGVTKRVDVPTEAPGGDLSKAFEDVVAGLKENQKAYRVEKNLTKAEKSRRFGNYQRIYDEARAAGKSSQEAEAMARKALGGEYTKNTVGNVEIDQKTRDVLFDKVSKSDDSLNTKKAFEHLFDAERTEPLRNWERSRIRRFVQKEIGEEAAQALDEAITVAEQSGDRSVGGKIADFMTSAIAAGDISAVGRQGLSGLINHPAMSKRAWDDALKALVSADGEKAFAARLIDDADTAFIQENMGGKYLSLSDTADEARGGDTTNKAISWYVDPSNRHYNTYLDSLRHQQKKAIIERYGGQEGFLKAAQEANPKDPKKWMKAWNDVIDRQSGRGSFSNFGSPTVGDMQVLFSARNLASKFQRLTAPLQFGLLKTNPSAYLYQLKETGTQAAVLLGTLAAINESGIAEIENGKIKIGNTRVDITGGFSTIFKAMNDLRKSLGIMNDNSENTAFSRSGDEVAKDFLQNQLAPTIGSLTKLIGVDWDEGEDKYGNKIDAKWWLGAAPLPAVAQTAINSATNGQNFLEGARNVGFDALGFNTNTYMSADDKDKAARAETADQVNPQLQSLRDTGLLSDSMIKALPDDVQEALSEGKQLNQDEVDSIRSQLVEGIGTGTGGDSDSAYRERGEYDKDIAALKLKKQVLESEPNPKPSDIKALEVQIKRSEVLKENDIPFELLETYQTTGVEDWRKLEEDDPDLFQQLWNIDELMTKAGGSYKRGSFDKQKYYQKESKGYGRGGSRGGGRSGSKLSTDFGKLTGSAPNAPKVRGYATLDQSTGIVPRIKLTRPNIVHTIREGRV